MNEWCPFPSYPLQCWSRKKKWYLSSAVIHSMKLLNQVYPDSNILYIKWDKHVCESHKYSIYVIQFILFFINLCVYCFHTILNLHVVQFSLTLNNTPGSTHQQHSWELLSQHLLQLAVGMRQVLLYQCGEEQVQIKLHISTLSFYVTIFRSKPVHLPAHSHISGVNNFHLQQSFFIFYCCNDARKKECMNNRLDLMNNLRPSGGQTSSLSYKHTRFFH